MSGRDPLRYATPMAVRLLALTCGWLTGPPALFRDGRVICLPTFGHTPGHQSLLVRLDGGDVVLAADACYFRERLDELRLSMIVHDPVAMLASLQRLRALAAVGARIVYGHDPGSWATMPQAPLAIT